MSRNMRSQTLQNIAAVVSILMAISVISIPFKRLGLILFVAVSLFVGYKLISSALREEAERRANPPPRQSGQRQG